ncbi:MAG: class I SAM-dependent methyltransferase [Bacillota bacterium]
MKLQTKYRRIIEDVKSYYTDKILSYGPCARGVDWNGEQSQRIRFQQLLKVITEPGDGFSIYDLGCGYGALAEYIVECGFKCDYVGYDISEEMIACAGKLWQGRAHPQVSVRFSAGDMVGIADYTVASGIFNVKLDTDEETWLNYVLGVLDDMNACSKKGFSFNILTKYSDAPYMKHYLYYADPSFFFDHCMRRYSRNVALLHDYGLYEFTIIVGK